jgi:hypothetical protein
VAESNGEDVQVPWFSGLCLQGEVAGQYEMERSGSQREDQEATKAGLLELDGLAPITIFVGANNSGKSRLLRKMFMEQYPLKFRLNSGFGDDSKSDIGKEVPRWISIILNQTPQASHEVSWIMNDELDQVNDLLESIEEKISAEKFTPNRTRTRGLASVQGDLLKYGIKGGIRGFQQAKRCYIPTLRGMRPPLSSPSRQQGIEISNDQYEQRTIHDYFEDIASWPSMRDKEKPRSSIFTGLSLYDNLRKRLLGRTQIERDTVREYQHFLSDHFFPGQPVSLVPAEYSNGGKLNDVVHIRIGEKSDFPIHQLGDGMQSLIICTYPIVTETEPGSLFFLEEPDLCMHPSLQRTFLEVLKAYHRKMGHQFFITTHSNHLLDLLEDNELVSIFSFSEIADRAPSPADQSHADSAANSQSSKPKPSFRIRPSDLEDRQTLVQLGVRPSATYLANATIWVEGVSDCAYLRAYMEAFVHYLKIRGNEWGTNLAQRLQQYKEDRHYAFVEYSGANLTHYSFKEGYRENGQAKVVPDVVTSVPNLCARAIVIADGDITTKGDRLKWYAKQLEERFVWLPCKEIENMIPETLMRSQVKRDYPNVDNKILAKIKHAGYRTQAGVGTYLPKLKIPEANYAAKGGTLTSYRKSNWASNLKGIPWLLRQELKSEKEAERDRVDIVDPANTSIFQAIDELQAKQELPNHLTQDIVWLCVCIYAHIAEYNHDHESEQKLRDFQKFIKEQGKISQEHIRGPNNSSQPSSASDDPPEFSPSEWPIKDINRNCFLAAYLSALQNA